MTIRSPTPNLRVWIDPHSLGKGARIRHRILTGPAFRTALVENQRGFVGTALPLRSVRPNRPDGDTAKGIIHDAHPGALAAARGLPPVSVAHHRERCPRPGH